MASNNIFTRKLHHTMSSGAEKLPHQQPQSDRFFSLCNLQIWDHVNCTFAFYSNFFLCPFFLSVLLLYPYTSISFARTAHHPISGPHLSQKLLRFLHSALSKPIKRNPTSQTHFSGVSFLCPAPDCRNSTH